VLGEHQGLAYYTLGQRQGLRVGGVRDGLQLPWFVAAKDRARNALVVVQGHDDYRLYRTEIEAESLHWIAGHSPEAERSVRLGAKTRYRMADASCTLELIGHDRVRARFDVPQWAPTPGQYLVLYDGEVCLGGAVIQEPIGGELAAQGMQGMPVAAPRPPAHGAHGTRR
jgi:tRNA-specific 2-thiouridylase